MKKIFECGQAKRASIDPANRTLEAVLTERMVDRDGEVIEPGGAILDNFRQNPVMLWGHDPSSPPIGFWSDFKVTPQRVEARANFLPPGKSARADEVWAAYEAGALRAFSIGFNPIEISDEPVLEGQEGATITKWELLEASAVSIPANVGAMAKSATNRGLENLLVILRSVYAWVLEAIAEEKALIQEFETHPVMQFYPGVIT